MLLCIPLFKTSPYTLRAQLRCLKKDLLILVSLQSHKILELGKEVAQYQRGEEVTLT